MDDIIIVGAGVGGLTLGLALHAAGIPCRIFESAAEIRAIGVGINLLPHATRELAALGPEAEPARGAMAAETCGAGCRGGSRCCRAPGWCGRDGCRAARW